MSQVKFFKLYRPPLELPNGPMIHFGMAVVDQSSGETWVLHNTPDKNEHLSSLDEFTAGLRWRYEELPCSQQLLDRFVAACNDLRLYNFLTNNCQHTVNRVADSVPWSPGLWVAGFAVVGLVAYAVKKSGGRPTV